MIHIHRRWKVAEKQEQPSPMELSKNFHFKGSAASVFAISTSMLDARRPMIVTYRCDCGAEKVKRV